MTAFDQRGQKVNKQINVAGNFNFGTSNNADISPELQKLLEEIRKAIKSGDVDAETGIDVEAKVKKAIVQSEKPNPDKNGILDNINGAKLLIEGMSSAVNLVTLFIQASDMVRRLL
jgi:hypothetical protein